MLFYKCIGIIGCLFNHLFCLSLSIADNLILLCNNLLITFNLIRCLQAQFCE